MGNDNSQLDSLLARRDELQRRLVAIRNDLRRGLSADDEDRAIELENFDTLQEIARVSEVELTKLEAELQAIQKGKAQSD